MTNGQKIFKFSIYLLFLNIILSFFAAIAIYGGKPISSFFKAFGLCLLWEVGVLAVPVGIMLVLNPYLENFLKRKFLIIIAQFLTFTALQSVWLIVAYNIFKKMFVHQ